MIPELKNKIISTAIIFICGFSFIVYAPSHSFPDQSVTNPYFWIDVGIFQRSEQQALIEFYYSFSLNELSFDNMSGEILASFSFSISIKDSANKTVFTESRNRRARAASQADVSDKSKGIIDLFTFNLKQGDYSFECELTDKSTKATSKISGSFTVPPFIGQLCISELQMASLISSDLSNTLFVKGNRLVIPKPSRRYKCHHSLLYLYYEVYNLVTGNDSSKILFQVSYSITDLDNNKLLEVPVKSINKPGTSCIKMQAFDIRGFEPGEYILNIKAFDPASGQSAFKQKTFSIYEPEQDTMLLAMTSEDIQNYRDQIKYLATKEELELFDDLASEGKEKFLINFWRSRDPEPETPENQFMLDYFSRIDYANKHFKGKAKGMNTDMGRVFIMYGQPDDIEDHIWEMGKKPYAIWHYFAAGRRHDFVFVDRNNEGIYTLVHSTVEEEIKNENWMQQEIN